MDYDEKLEEFIEMKILVDCYDEYEVASSWYSFLSGELLFPFAARVKQPGFTPNEQVTVIGLEHDEECESGIFVEAKSEGGSLLSLPLESLELTEPHPTRQRALDAWKYGLEQGYGYDLSWDEE